MYEVDPERQLLDFITRCNIDIDRDRPRGVRWVPRISVVEHITASGTDYHFTQLDFYEGDEVKATRMVAEILPGNRTELAYWNEDAPRKKLDIHKGRCEMIVSNPVGQTTRIIESEQNGKYGHTLELPPGVFYTLRAPADSTEILVISGYYNQPIGEWSELETVVEPGQTIVQTSDGPIPVPKIFVELFS